MKTSKIIQAAHQLSKPYRITNGKKFRLKHVDPADTGELKSADKPRAKEALQNGVEAMAELQDVLYAQDRWSLLLIFQAMNESQSSCCERNTVSNRESSDGSDELAPPFYQNKQRQHEQQVIDAEQNVLHAQHQVGAAHFQCARRR